MAQDLIPLLATRDYCMPFLQAIPTPCSTFLSIETSSCGGQLIEHAILGEHCVPKGSASAASDATAPAAKSLEQGNKESQQLAGRGSGERNLKETGEGECRLHYIGTVQVL